MPLHTFRKTTILELHTVGKNTLGKIFFVIAKFLRLNDPEKYTNHCFQRT